MAQTKIIDPNVQQFRDLIKQNYGATDLLMKLRFIMDKVKPAIDEIIETSVRHAQKKLKEGTSPDLPKEKKGSSPRPSRITSSYKHESKDGVPGGALTPIPEVREPTKIVGYKHVDSDEEASLAGTDSSVDRDSHVDFSQSIPSSRPTIERQETPFPTQLLIDVETTLERMGANKPIAQADTTKESQPAPPKKTDVGVTNVRKRITDLTDQLLSPLRESVRKDPAVVKEMTVLLEKLSKTMDTLIVKYPQLQQYSSVLKNTVYVHRCILVEAEKHEETAGPSQAHQSSQTHKRTPEKHKYQQRKKRK